MTTSPENRLKELGLILPEASMPAANYIPAVTSGNVVTVSGQLPMEGGQAKFIGKLGKDISLEDGKKAAQQCVLNVIAHLQVSCGGDLSRVKRCIRLGVFVNSTPEFTDQPQVANGASDLIVELFGKENGSHARAAVGVAQLPRGVAVEVEGMFEIS